MVADRDKTSSLTLQALNVHDSEPPKIAVTNNPVSPK